MRKAVELSDDEIYYLKSLVQKDLNETWGLLEKEEEFRESLRDRLNSFQVWILCNIHKPPLKKR